MQQIYTLVLFHETDSKVLTYTEHEWQLLKDNFLKYYHHTDCKLTLLINGIDVNKLPLSITDIEITYIKTLYNDIKKSLLDIKDESYTAHIINPPPFMPSLYDIEKAHVRYFINHNLLELFSQFKYYFEKTQYSNNQLETKELRVMNFVKNTLQREIKQFGKSIEEYTKDKKKKELWEILVSKEWFHASYVRALNSHHCGDCTSVATNCDRCSAESAFYLPYTTVWNRKNGNELLLDYLNNKGYQSNEEE